MRILALETSCDDSAVAYLEVARGHIARLEYLTATQEIHKKYGGVVPEVAAREHAATVPTLLRALADKVVGAPDGKALSRVVDRVAATRGPGLVTSLRVGFEAAKTLALAWNKPLLGINHIEGHVYSNWLSASGGKLFGEGEKIFPALVLVVSGGHTELLYMKSHCQYRLLGATRDDAAGEAFDKTAKLMGLGYPGGPAIAKLAEQGNPLAHDFPRPMRNDPHNDFSFAGLKTAVRYFLAAHPDSLADEAFRADVAASLQAAIVDVLVDKTVRAAVGAKVKTVFLAGGVAANASLRKEMARAIKERAPGVRFVEPSRTFCTDNAAMIAMAAYFRAKGIRLPQNDILLEADPGWELGRPTL